MGNHECYGPPVPVTAVVRRCQGGLALYSIQLLIQLLYRDVSGSWHCMVCSFWIQFYISLILGTVDQKPILVKSGYMCFGQYTPHMNHTVSLSFTQENAADLHSLGNTWNDSWQKTHKSCQKISLHHSLYYTVLLIYYNHAKFIFIHSSNHTK
jgi:hypothetical protein